MNNPSDDTPKDPESPVGINSAIGQTLNDRIDVDIAFYDVYGSGMRLHIHPSWKTTRGEKW